ncbi:MAG: hypothetical protein R3D52_08870 [Xanthobacteraceae bacterium]
MLHPLGDRIAGCVCQMALVLILIAAPFSELGTASSIWLYSDRISTSFVRQEIVRQPSALAPLPRGDLEAVDKTGSVFITFSSTIRMPRVCAHWEAASPMCFCRQTPTQRAEKCEDWYPFSDFSLYRAPGRGLSAAKRDKSGAHMLA